MVASSTQLSRLVAAQHDFPPDFPSVEVATSTTSLLTSHPGFYGLVAEQDGRIIGSSFADMRSPIAGFGPISVDPAMHSQGIGRRLMHALLDHATMSNVAGIRLIQHAYNTRSLCLYTRLGFQVREPLSMMRGPPLKAQFAGYSVPPSHRGGFTRLQPVVSDSAWLRSKSGAIRCD